MKVFLDTNVLLDILMDSRENNVNSTSILRVANGGYIDAVASTQSVLDAFYIFVNGAKGTPSIFKSSLNEFLNVVEIASISADNLETAMSSLNNNLEDAAQIACAESSACECIISSDVKMKRDSELPVYTPSEFCDQIFGPWK